MKIKNFDIEGIKLIELEALNDSRGYFVESFSEKRFISEVSDCKFVQDNESKSLSKGTLRGLHAQKPPHAQDKLVRVIQGSIWDIAVDIRKNSSTYGSWVGVNLSEGDLKQFYIPKGFLHGFITLSDNTIVSYKCSNYYCKSSEISLIYNDIDLSIDWPIKDEIKISEKDLSAERFKDFLSPFK